MANLFGKGQNSGGKAGTQSLWCASPTFAVAKVAARSPPLGKMRRRLPESRKWLTKKIYAPGQTQEEPALEVGGFSVWLGACHTQLLPLFCFLCEWAPIPHLSCCWARMLALFCGGFNWGSWQAVLMMSVRPAPGKKMGRWPSEAPLMVIHQVRAWGGGKLQKFIWHGKVLVWFKCQRRKRRAFWWNWDFRNNKWGEKASFYDCLKLFKQSWRHEN